MARERGQERRAEDEGTVNVERRLLMKEKGPFKASSRSMT